MARLKTGGLPSLIELVLSGKQRSYSPLETVNRVCRVAALIGRVPQTGKARNKTEVQPSWWRGGYPVFSSISVHPLFMSLLLGLVCLAMPHASTPSSPLQACKRVQGHKHVPRRAGVQKVRVEHGRDK